MYCFQRQIKSVFFLACTMSVLGVLCMSAIKLPILRGIKTPKIILQENQNTDSFGLATDSLGNAYGAWTVNNCPYAGVKLSGNSSWEPSLQLSTDPGYPPSIIADSAGRVVVAWMGPQVGNPNQYTIYVSMFYASNFSWTVKEAITDPSEAMMNAGIGMSIQDDPNHPGEAIMNFMWMSEVGGALVMRTNSATFGSSPTWAGPSTLP